MLCWILGILIFIDIETLKNILNYNCVKNITCILGKVDVSFKSADAQWVCTWLFALNRLKFSEKHILVLGFEKGWMWQNCVLDLYLILVLLVSSWTFDCSPSLVIFLSRNVNKFIFYQICITKKQQVDLWPPINLLCGLLCSECCKSFIWSINKTLLWSPDYTSLKSQN